MRSAASPAFRRLCLGLALLATTWSLPGVVLADAYPLQAVKAIADALKPNVLIVLETAESMQGLAGENIARYNQVGADCEDGNRYCRLVGQDGRWNFSGMGAYGMGVAGAVCTNTGTYTDVGITSTTTSTSYDTTTPTTVNTFVSLNATATGTGTGSGSHAITGTATKTATGTSAATGTAGTNPTVSITGTVTSTVTGTWTANYTSTVTNVSTTLTATGTKSVSMTTTNTSLAAATFSDTVSATQTATLNATVSTTGNATVTGTGNGTASATQTVTASASATGSVTANNTVTVNGTDTATGTVSGTVTATASTGETVTGTGSGTGSAQVTQTQTVTAQVVTTASAAVTGTGTGTATVTANGITGTATATGTGTGSMTATQSKTQTATGSASTMAGTGTANNTAYVTSTPTGIATGTASYSGSGCSTATWTYSGMLTKGTQSTDTATSYSTTIDLPSGTVSASSTFTATASDTAGHTMPITVTRTATASSTQPQNGLIGTATWASTATVTRTASLTATWTTTNNMSFTGSWSGTQTTTSTYPSATATTTATTTQTTTVAGTHWTTGTACATLTGTMTITVTGNVTGLATVIATAQATGTATQTATALVTLTKAITGTGTVTGTMSGGITGSATMTGTIGGTGTKTYNTTTTSTTSTHISQSGTDTATYVATQTRTGCGVIGDQDLNRCDAPPATPTTSGPCDEAGTTSCSSPTVCTAFRGDFCHQIATNDGSHRNHVETCITTPGTPWGSCKHGVVGDNTTCNSYSDGACNTALAGDYCIEGQPAKMCSDSGLWCANASDCPGTSETCVYATSRLMTVKRALRRAVTDYADKVSFGLMTTYQGKGIDATDTNATTAVFPYVKLTSCPTTPNVTETKLLTRGELEKSGCFSLTAGPAATCTVDYGGNGALNSDPSLNRIDYQRVTVAGSDSRWIIPRGDGSGKFDHLNTSWLSCPSTALLPACVFTQGTGVYEGSYYSFSYRQGTPIANGTTPGEGSMAHPVYLSKYMGKFYSDGSNCFNAIDAQRSDIINDGIYGRPAYSLVPPASSPYAVIGTGTNTNVAIDTNKEASLSVPWSGAAQNTTCGSKTGALYTPAALPFMTDTTFGGQALSRAQKGLMYAGRLDKASFGGVTATGAMSPVACALDNDQASDQFHSAAGYITQAKANDTAANGNKPACWPNNIILVVDGHADGPGDSGGAIDCASDGCAHGDVDGYANCNCAAITKAYHLAHDQGVQTHVVVNAPANWGETGRYRYTYGFLVNLAKAGSFGFVGAPAFGTSEEELYKGISDKIAAGAYAFPFTTTVPVAGATTQDPDSQVLTPSQLLFDTSVDYPAWKGNLRAFATGSGSAQLSWDAVGVAYGSTPHPTSWKGRRIFFAPKSTSFPLTPIQVAIDQSSGAITNKSDLHSAGLGASDDEAEHIMQWLLGRPDLGNPAPLMGAVTASTPIAVAQGTSNGLNGSATFSKNTWKRPQLVYVGGDDGMLHAFFGHVGTKSLNSINYLGGEEAFAFIPNDMLPVITKLYAQSGQNLAVDKSQHVFGLAGSPKVKDICTGSGCENSTGSDWHTVLMMTEGPGGNRPFALDITNVISDSAGLDFSKLNLLWSAATLSNAATWDKDLGETTALPGFYFAGYVSGAADNRVIFASGYPTVSRSKSGYDRQGLLIVNADAATGAIIETKDVGSLPSSTCSQNRAVRSDVAVARDYSSAATSQSLMGAYVTDTWGNAYQYVPNATGGWSRLYTLGCGQPLHFAPAIAQLDRVPQADSSSKHFIYLVQVTNSSYDPDTQPYSSSFPGSQIVVTKLDGNVVPPILVPSFNSANGGQIVLATDASTPSNRICLQNFNTTTNSFDSLTSTGTGKGAGQACSDINAATLPITARPVGTPTLVLRSDGLGFQVITSWYDVTTMSNDCSTGKQFNYGTSYVTVHEFGADGTWYQIAGVTISNTVLTGVTFVGTGLFVDGIMGANDNAPQGLNAGEAFASMQQVLNNKGLERYSRTSWSERLQ